MAKHLKKGEFMPTPVMGKFIFLQENLILRADLGYNSLKEVFFGFSNLANRLVYLGPLEEVSESIEKFQKKTSDLETRQ